MSGEFVAAVAGGKVIGCGGQGQYGFLGDCHALSSCGEWERQVDGPAKQDAHVTATSTGEVIWTGGWGDGQDTRTASTHMLKDGQWSQRAACLGVL